MKCTISFVLFHVAILERLRLHKRIHQFNETWRIKTKMYCLFSLSFRARTFFSSNMRRVIHNLCHRLRHLFQDSGHFEGDEEHCKTMPTKLSGQEFSDMTQLSWEEVDYSGCLLSLTDVLSSSLDTSNFMSRVMSTTFRWDTHDYINRTIRKNQKCCLTKRPLSLMTHDETSSGVRLPVTSSVLGSQSSHLTFLLLTTLWGQRSFDNRYGSRSLYSFAKYDNCSNMTFCIESWINNIEDMLQWFFSV